MLKQIRRHVRFGFVLLLPAYFIILGNSVMNRHTHVLPNGIMVTHAHPFAKDVDGKRQTSHHHSGKDFLFLQSFCVGGHLVSDNSVDFSVLFSYRDLKFPLVEYFFQSTFISGNSQRGPPVS